MLDIQVIEEIPNNRRENNRPNPRKRLIAAPSGYISGYIKLPDGRRSPLSEDPMAPFHWLARQ